MHAQTRSGEAFTIPRGYSIGVDIGGTFTDCAIVGPDGAVYTGKAPTTPGDRSQGFFASIGVAAEGIGLSLSDLFSRTERIVHGTTTGTNAIVARHGARIALVTTAGHGDVMFLMRGSGRTSGLPPDELLDVPATAKPQPLVPKQLIFEVAERMDVDGDVVVALDEDAVRAAGRALHGSGVEAVCVSFLWSIKNPAHEHRARELLLQEAPGLFVSCASDLVVRLGEYERTTAGLMNAYIGPLMLRYVGGIEDGARSRGFTREVLFAQCAGGAISGNEARAAPIRTVQSGPVAGIVSSVYWAQQAGYRDLIAADMGGTTFDVSVVRDGLPLERDLSVFQRYELALPMLDVESIGAGGGSIAWLDASGRLNVGPQSAGADPGPACYGIGQQATVTDADVVLGVIDPGRFLGGRMKIDRQRALAALRCVGEQLGLDPLQTAAGITRIIDARMADLIRRMSVMRGFDPRRFACLAFGGGGPVHCGAVAREAGMHKVVVPLPRTAAVWSAFGAAASDVTHVYQEADLLELPAPPHRITAPYERLERRAIAQLSREGFAAESIVLRRTARMKYAMQVHDVEVPVSGLLAGTDINARLLEDFERVYEQLFGQGSGYREGGVQLTSVQVRAIGLTAKPKLAFSSGSGTVERTSRRVFWPESAGYEDTPVLRVSGDFALQRTAGPVLIELADTVIVVRPGQIAYTDDFGNVIVDLPHRPGAQP